MSCCWCSVTHPTQRSPLVPTFVVLVMDNSYYMCVKRESDGCWGVAVRHKSLGTVWASTLRSFTREAALDQVRLLVDWIYSDFNVDGKVRVRDLTNKEDIELEVKNSDVSQ